MERGRGWGGGRGAGEGGCWREYGKDVQKGR